MHVLLIGAYGFIGSEVARALIARGHMVRGVGRDIAYGRQILPSVEWHHVDLAFMDEADRWRPLLAGIDVVINASGLLQDENRHGVQAVQRDAIVALIAACATAAILRFVQISAANAQISASSPFLRSKAEADQHLIESRIAHIILRPGLVIGRNAYGGTELLRTAAALPFMTVLPQETGSIQCIGMDDVVDAVASSAEGGVPSGSYDLVEHEARPLGNIVALLRTWLGIPEARRTVRMGSGAMALIGYGADLLGRLGWQSPLRSNGLAALLAGVSGAAAHGTVVLGRPVQSLEAVLAAMPAGKQDRIAAQLLLLLPWALASLFLLWMGSALATAFQLEAATTLLCDGGLGVRLARLSAVAGALIDAALALMLLHRRTVRFALLGTIVTTIAYLAAAAVVRPDFWIDPLAPLLKAIPAAVLSLVAYILLAKR